MKVLNYALSGEAGRGNCLRFVEAMGLKVLFPIFMGKVSSDDYSSILLIR